MADQCIICLEDLGTSIPQNDSAPSLSDAPSTSDVDQSSQSSELNVAVIKPCNHILHDSCLQTWTEKANSCPICRQNFNEVEVYDKIEGNHLSTYTVEDKKQVADFDYLSWDENNPEYVESLPCPLCGEYDQEDSLLVCDGCDANYHAHCLNMHEIPHDQWFCMECASANAIGMPNNRQARSQANQLRRRARQIRATQWQGAWTTLNNRVWENLNIDLDSNDTEGSLADFRRHEVQLERDRNRWQQRLRIASRQGARTSFQDAIRPRVNRTREVPLVEPEETAEEAASWRAMERAQELEGPSATASRKRKSRSATASANTSPAEPPAEPERKLKRPRTRRVLDAAPNLENGAESSRRLQSLPSRRADHQPSLVSGLLDEIQQTSPVVDNDSRYYFGANSSPIPYGDQSSRAVSPASSNYSTPRGMSITPPPQISKRPSSPMPLTSHVMPTFQAGNYSPTRASPTSPSNSDGYDAHFTELRHPRPRNRNHNVVQQRSDEVSPTRANMTLEVKEEINRMVLAALKGYWKSGDLSKDQYEMINKSVSRSLYERVGELGGGQSPGFWEKIAETEVAKAVRGL